MADQREPSEVAFAARLRRLRDRTVAESPTPPLVFGSPSSPQRIAAFAAGAVAALGLVAVGLMAHLWSSAPPTGTHGTGARAGAAIPWISTQGTTYRATAPPPARTPCTAKALQVDNVTSGVYSGFAADEIQLSNHSSTACYLAGQPTVVMSLSGGGSQVVSPASGAPPRIDLPPGGGLAIAVGSQNVCSAGTPVKKVARLDLTLPGVGDVLSADGRNLIIACSAPAILFVQPTDSAANSAEPAPVIPALQVSLALPQKAARGSTLSYTVTVSNSSTSALTLSPCPSYTQVLNAAGMVMSEDTLLLNCSAQNTIPPNSHLTFQMQSTIPADTPLGPLKVSWQLQTADGAASGGVVQIVR